MMISATYICPVKGLASLEPRAPARLGQAARVAKGPEEYLVDPQIHLFRLWEHFRESN